MADALLAAAQANAGAFDTATWSLKLLGGSGATCAGSSRTLEVKGSPNTTAHLKITAGTAQVRQRRDRGRRPARVATASSRSR